jgi:hypothetical protein
MQMVRHHREGDDLDPEDGRPRLEAIADPGPAMIEVLSAHRIVATKEGAPNATSDTVVGADFALIDQFATRVTTSEQLLKTSENF